MQPFLIISVCLLTLHEPIPTKLMGYNTALKITDFTDNKEILAFYKTR